MAIDQYAVETLEASSQETVFGRILAGRAQPLPQYAVSAVPVPFPD